MIFAKWESIIFTDNITILGGNLPVAFLGFNFLMILLICSVVAKGVSYLFYDLLSMLMILRWFSYFLSIDSTVDISRVLLFGFASILGALPDAFLQYLRSEN